MGNTPPKGLVVLAGAGPGNPGLITLEAVRWLARADIVFHDRLACPQLLDHAPATAQRVYVGKSRDDKAFSQDEINRLLVEAGQAGKLVVRLKGGDPFIFGRGGEEAAALKAAGVEYRVVPGVTAASGAAAWCGLPLTDRRLAGSVAFVTAQEDPARQESRLNWAALAGIDTVVFFMGV
jgi:uroporphyrinogen III methyltransferase / synthase